MWKCKVYPLEWLNIKKVFKMLQKHKISKVCTQGNQNQSKSQ